MKKIKMLLLSALAAVALCNPAFAAEKSANAVAKEVAQKETMQQVEQMHAVQGDKINVNLATAAELQQALLGVGAKKAEAIVQYREKYGKFTSPEQLLEVQGIGKVILEKNRERLLF